MSKPLQGRTIIVTGASRGIGRAMALRFAADGANVVVAAKSNVRHPKLPGTIHSVAAEVEQAGGGALPIKVDVRDEAQVLAMIEQTVAQFGGLDALVNNAGAIYLASVQDTPLKRYDLMQNVNVRAAFLCTQAALPHLRRAANPHVLTLSPPISLDPKWYAGHAAYTISKFGMSMLTLGMSAELASDGVAVNSLWPRTTIATAAIDMLMGEEGRRHSRTPEIMADAAYEILTTPARQLTGRCLLDEDVLRSRGVDNFDGYAVEPGAELFPDLFVD